MAVKKKLAIKKNKGKLVVHKKAVDTTPVDEPTEDDVIHTDVEPEIKAPAKKKIVKKKKVVEEAVGKVSVKKEDSHEDVSTEHVADVEVEGHMANVGYNMARTINLGNYESIKVGVSINIPSLVDVDEIEGNYEFAKQWVEEKMVEVVDKYTDEG